MINEQSSQTKEYNIILWNMNYVLASRNPNIGDKVLLDSIIKSLNNLQKNINILIFTSDPKIVKSDFNVNGIKYDILHIYSILRILWKADLFVFAGGEVVIDRGSSLYTPFMMHCAFIAKLMKKKIIGYGIGVGEIKEISSIGKLISRYIFNGAVISVRDNRSGESLKSFSRPKKLLFTADPALNLEAKSKKDVDDILGNIGINRNEGMLIAVAPRQPLMPVKNILDRFINVIPMKIRELFKLTPYKFKVYLNIFEERLAEISDYLIEKYNAKVIFIPMFSGFMSYRDDILCNNIIKKMKFKNEVKMLKNSYPGSILKSFYGEMDLVIGFPLHSIILATSMGVPSIAFAYESKVSRYMNAIGLESSVFKIDDISQVISKEEVIKVIDFTIANKVLIKEDMMKQIKCLKEKEIGNINMLIDEISENDYEKK
jgi:polysaccharide pyruvyl transferase WcaK-like protein